jgi:hypothetical protein
LASVIRQLGADTHVVAASDAALCLMRAGNLYIPPLIRSAGGGA